MTDITKVRALINESDVAKEFFTQLSSRVKNYRRTTLDHGEKIANASRSDVVELFRQMEELDLGVYRLGRRGQPTRFEWSVAMVETARAALGEGDDVLPLEDSELYIEENSEEEEEEEEGDHIEHRYVLRRDLTAHFSLPADLTKVEAERLSKFILTLPLDE